MAPVVFIWMERAVRGTTLKVARYFLYFLTTLLFLACLGMVVLHVYLFAWSWMGTSFHPPSDELLSESRRQNFGASVPYVIAPAAVDCAIIIVIVKFRRARRDSSRQERARLN